MQLSLQIPQLLAGYREGAHGPAAVVDEVLRRIRAHDDEAVWTHRVAEDDLYRRAAWLEANRDRIDSLPLYGVPFCVKDNLDVAGVPTTCGCAAYDRLPERHAASVQKLLEAGAILIGKNSLDQFATGLNGTRTHGAHCRNVFDARYIPGGSSSGSGVAVAARLVSFALGSDTGGSGRVPAAMNNIVGLRPSLGLVSNRGLVHNSRFFDVVPVFAQTVDDAYAVLEQIQGHDPGDPTSCPDADAIGLAAGAIGSFRFGVPDERFLDRVDEASRTAFAAAVERLREIGGSPRTVDYAFFAQAGGLVFDSALVAERVLNYGEVLDAGADSVHPAVRSILERAREYSATDALHAIYRMQEMRAEARRRFAHEGIDVLVTPTVPRPITCAEIAADPIGANSEIGLFTYGVAVLDQCALALPAAIRPDGLPFGISLVGPANADALLRSIGLGFQAATGIVPGAPAAPRA